MTRNGQHHQRLLDLRAELARRNLAGYVVAHTDEHGSEYTPAYAQRLAWLTGFDGSAGLAVALQDKAAIFVDGRYTLQARAQVDAADYEYKSLVEDDAAKWIAETAKAGDRIGYDPWLHNEGWVNKASDTLTAAGLTLVAVAGNPIDAVWTDQPAPPKAPAEPYDVTYAGVASAAKRAAIAEEMTDVDAVMITALDSIAWLLNLRGRDVARTPVALSFLILHRSGEADLYIDPDKVTPRLRAHLGNTVRIHPKTAFLDGLSALGAAKKTVAVDADTAAVAVLQTLSGAGATIKRRRDPCVLPKATKNATELAGMRAAHHRDGAALTRFLAWIDHEGPSGKIDEIAAAERLEAFRAATGMLKDLSFDTISAAGPNGAIVHYRVTDESNRRIAPGSLYLIDSGGQYLDGTTDVTRTVAIGAAPDEARRIFTLVLKGHIAIASARFPRGTSGAQLDVLARAALWREGLDYSHGTGHGVGCYLSVHEGPQRIAKTGAAALLPGMILSNEPGYYKAGEFGIRIENLLAVRPSDVKAELELLEFEVLTLAPIDRKLIVPELLNGDERAWLDDYHARVRNALTPLVDADTARWLAAATAPL
ncbi:MAG: X-Pro aminopeptidase [Proteobacteria bacterium]|nr:MAG: X-Pro aminopeptidase [Pseudomonadota bacterium]